MIGTVHNTELTVYQLRCLLFDNLDYTLCFYIFFLNSTRYVYLQDDICPTGRCKRSNMYTILTLSLLSLVQSLEMVRWMPLGDWCPQSPPYILQGSRDSHCLSWMAVLALSEWLPPEQALGPWHWLIIRHIINNGNAGFLILTYVFRLLTVLFQLKMLSVFLCCFKFNHLN